MTSDNGKGLRALFYGLCTLHGIEVLDMQEADAMPSDFCIVDGKFSCHVVILPEPPARQVEIKTLRHRDVPLIVLDRHDLDIFRRCPNGAEAAAMIEFWLRNGTHASSERQRMGIG